MLSKFKRNKHQQHLAQLPKISQSVDDVDFFYAPADFRETLLEKIASAKQRICIVALYLEQDDGGKGILNALYEAKGGVGTGCAGAGRLASCTTWTHWRCGI